MSLQLAQAKSAQQAYALVKDLQHLLVKKLDEIPPTHSGSRFVAIDWLRAQGKCGGGTRLAATDEQMFNRASVNVSQVQYENDPSKKMGSASAISTIVHPRNPFAPSMHLHISWTEMKSGEGYWRIMADLNPSLPHEGYAQIFRRALQDCTGALFDLGSKQGEQYFYIPALGRHRGVVHYYLEEFKSHDKQADANFARKFGETMITAYSKIVREALASAPKPGADELKKQLEYHTLYFLQVLTLDRGTTSGLLVHNENDTGILGSLPSHVDKKLLKSWLTQHPPMQQELLKRLIDCLPDGSTSHVDDSVKLQIAQAARSFYQQYPEAQDLLAKGYSIPPTVDNHR